MSRELKEGFVTIPGGHRCGFAGRTVVQDGAVTGLREISSINIRIARQVVGCADGILPYIYDRSGLRSGLIVSPAGRREDDGAQGPDPVAVLRGPESRRRGRTGRARLHVRRRAAERPRPARGRLDGTPKKEGILQALRCLSPDVIVFDELGDEAEAEAVLQGMGAGVPVIFSCMRAAREAARRPSGGKAAGRGRGRRNRSVEGARRPGTFGKCCACSGHMGKGTV